MFVSFFPSPRIFFWSAAIWSLLAVLAWFFFFKDFGVHIGLPNPPDDVPPVIGLSVFWSPSYIWFYIYYFAATTIFAVFWQFYAPHPWSLWSVLGSSLIVFSSYYWVEVGVVINNWYGPFYDLLQNALAKPRTQEITAGQFWVLIGEFLSIALVAVIIRALSFFFYSHYIFRWRTAMNDYYTANWHKLKNIEGASQRVQEDTMKLAENMENLGISLINSLLTLVAFLPVLSRLSANVGQVPLLGAIPEPLVVTAILWAIFGTAFLATLGLKLPGLEFRNQRVEAAYRKELVYGEDHENRAQPLTLREMFWSIRKNYFNLYFNYMYFNVGAFMYGQVDAIFGAMIMIPTLVAGTITLGVYQQIRNAFNQVRDSFQYLVNSWKEIIKTVSIYKRLRTFESAITGEPIDPKSEYASAGEIRVSST